jgi:hypothetical protein
MHGYIAFRGRLDDFQSNGCFPRSARMRALALVLCSLTLGAELALRAQNVTAWGVNTLGQADVPGAVTNAISVAAGAAHSVALLADGTVVAWGDNSLGQTEVPPSATNIVAIAAGDFISLALRQDGGVLAWGTNAAAPFSVTNAVAAGIMPWRSWRTVRWSLGEAIPCARRTSPPLPRTLSRLPPARSIALLFAGRALRWFGVAGVGDPRPVRRSAIFEGRAWLPRSWSRLPRVLGMILR